MYLFLFTLTLYSCVHAGACVDAEVAAGDLAFHFHSLRGTRGGGDQDRPSDELLTNQRRTETKQVKHEDPETVIEPKLDDNMSEDSSASIEGSEENINNGENRKDYGIEIPTSSAVSAERGADGAAGAGAACAYRLPEREQVDAMLSDMMNQLTRVFIRMENYVHRMQRGRGNHEKRYRLVTRKREKFFETIFANMTQEFRGFLNETTTSSIVRAGRDPCRHQREMRQLWRALLDHAQSSYWKAALRCVNELMLLQTQARARVRGHAPPSSSQSPETRQPPKSAETVRRPGGLAREAVLRRLAPPPRTLRAAQLAALCGRFRRCHHELL